MALRRLLRTLSLVFTVCAVVSASGRAHADEPVAPEAEENPASFPPPASRLNLVLVGAAVTAGWYGAAVGMSYGWSDSNAVSALRIPVAGPYMALGKMGCSSREPNCDTGVVVVRALLTTLSAIGQTGGILAILEGAFVPTSAVSPPSAVLDRAARSRDGASTHVAVVPTSFGSESLGIGVYGDF